MPQKIQTFTLKDEVGQLLNVDAEIHDGGNIILRDAFESITLSPGQQSKLVELIKAEQWKRDD